MRILVPLIAMAFLLNLALIDAAGAEESADDPALTNVDVSTYPWSAIGKLQHRRFLHRVCYQPNRGAHRGPLHL
jgi:hypothetical protein